VIVDLQMVGLLDPWAPRCLGGETGRLPEGLRNRGQHLRRECEGLASWHVPVQQGLQAARRLAREPIAEGMAMDPSSLSHGPAGVGLPTGQEVEPREPWLLATIMFVLQVRLAGCRIVTHDR
jgi:hypothetical protein